MNHADSKQHVRLDKVVTVSFGVYTKYFIDLSSTVGISIVGDA